jgi:hypothetical protein
MDWELLAKVVFITVVLSFAIYILINNRAVRYAEKFTEKQTDSTKKTDEKKEDKPKDISQRIKETYLYLFNMPPSKEETDFYVKFFKGKTNVTDEMLTNTIATSAPTLQKTIHVGNVVSDKDILAGTADEITYIFNEILDRNPSPDELKFYTKMLKKDPKQIEKMKVLLMQSKEYEILQNMQSNKTNALTLRGVTDRQVEFIVKTIYGNVKKSDEDIDEETLQFLKKKFVELDMDQAVFARFVKSIVSFTAEKPKDTQSVKSVVVSASGTQASVKDQPSGTERKSSTSSSQRANEKVTQCLEKEAFSTIPGSNDKPITCAMLKAIEDKAKEQFPRNRETSLSSTIHQRNRDELKQICDRNKRFSKFHDEDMVYLPEQEWSIPTKHPPVCIGGDASFNPLMTQSSLIGTLLNDAKSTSVS